MVLQRTAIIPIYYIWLFYYILFHILTYNILCIEVRYILFPLNLLLVGSEFICVYR